MQDEDLPESGNVEDRRGEGGFAGGGGFGRGGLGGIPGGAGGLSIGTIVVIGLISYALGIDPRRLLDGAEIATRDQPSVNRPTGQRKTCTPQDESGRFVARVLGSTEAVWKDVFVKQGGAYRAPVLVLFSGATSAPCGGVARRATGPFYCPNDQKVYIDLRFYKVLEQRLGAPGQFAQAYVVAHEVGHHVQNQLGIMDKVDALRGRGGEAQANALSVRVELQADCFAGVWAARSQKENGWRLDPGDIESALNAAAQIGDDTLQKKSQGMVVPETFTHGTSAQRVNWFKRGVEGGSIDRCNTFEGRDL